MQASEYAGSSTCAACHRDQYERWSRSDHYRAMQEASDANVLGDFADADFEHFGVHTRFFRRDGGFFVITDNAHGEGEVFQISHVFGYYPLQQYLVKFPDGRYQPLSVSWDSRPAEQGGQRWFHLYPAEAIPHADILHWTGAFQNWNSRCAGCHSTNLRKNYDAGTNTYATSWSEINVACETCHGPAGAHVAAANAGKALESRAAIQSLADRGTWGLGEGAVIAHRQDGKRPREQVETCAHCHARRSELEEVPVGKSFLDAHQSRFLERDLYYPDGQILEEVYEYDAFLQSRMHAAGVVCSDCHDPHSGELRAEGNGVCVQCHQAATYDTTVHHHHVGRGPGTTCVDCHAPQTTYMVVDSRHDHAFRIPRPDLSVALATPNACTGCHVDRNAAWAAAAVENWYGKTRRESFAPVMARVRDGDPAVVPELVALAKEGALPAIVRATAVQELRQFPDPQAVAAAVEALESSEPMLRIAAVRALEILPPEQRQILLPLAEDPVKAVRMEVAPLLAGVTGPGPAFPALQHLFDEYLAAQRINADMPEAQMNLGGYYWQTGNIAEAEQAYRQALLLSPRYVPAMVNLADLFRVQGRDQDAKPLLQAAIRFAPEQAAAWHALGLLLVRQQDLTGALVRLAKAAELEPRNARYGYVYAVALQSAGRLQQAIVVLETALGMAPADPDILSALVQFHQAGGSATKAAIYRQQLLALYPAAPPE